MADPDPKSFESRRPTHAGGIVYQIENDKVSYLIVRPKGKTDEWVFPKGHIEKGENETDAALREVAEEAGAVGRIICPVGIAEYRTEKESVRVKLYLMQLLFKRKPQESREAEWAAFEDSLKKLTHDRSRKLLAEAERLRRLREGERGKI